MVNINFLVWEDSTIVCDTIDVEGVFFPIKPSEFGGPGISLALVENNNEHL